MKRLKWLLKTAFSVCEKNPVCLLEKAARKAGSESQTNSVVWAHLSGALLSHPPTHTLCSNTLPPSQLLSRPHCSSLSVCLLLCLCSLSLRCRWPRMWLFRFNQSKMFASVRLVRFNVACTRAWPVRVRRLESTAGPWPNRIPLSRKLLRLMCV